MKQQSTHIKEPLSNKILLAYLEGSLPESNMQEVKRLVDNNPLYKDALDGLRWMDNPEDIHSILPSLKSTEKKARILTLPRLAAAAGIALLVTGGILAVRLAHQQQSQTLFAEHFEKPDTTDILPESKEKDAAALPDTNKPEATARPEPITSAPKLPRMPAEMTVVQDDLPEIAITDETPLKELVDDSDVTMDTEKEEAKPAPERPTSQSTNAGMKQAAGNTRLASAAEHFEMTAPISRIKTLYQANNFAETLTEADDALKNDTVNSELHLYKGLAHLGLDQPAEAKKSFDKVLALDDGFQDTANWYKALTLIKLGNKKEARNLLASIAEGTSPFAAQATELLKDL